MATVAPPPAAPAKAKTARIPITNIYADGDYTGIIQVGQNRKPLNVLLDTGSSTLAFDARKYQPNTAGGDQTTNLAQTDSYGDGSNWVGAVIHTELSIGDGASTISLAGGNAAVSYTASSDMWGQYDGILGLAYAPLDDAFTMPDNTWTHQYTGTQVRTGKSGQLKPYLTQLADNGVVSDIISFLTRRSAVHAGAGGLNDPLNQGVVVVGGGEESTDLYTGPFQVARVLSDDWYSTNMKALIVGNSDPIVGRRQGPQGMASNSIVDSGTNSLNLGSTLLKAVISKFSAPQQALLQKGLQGKPVTNSELNIASWPTITIILEGSTTDVTLQVPPQNYWQLDSGTAGQAALAITQGEPGLAILGLPVMNGYFTIFDGEADNGRGVIKFAKPAA
jgi:hypothetical protein